MLNDMKLLLLCLTLMGCVAMAEKSDWNDSSVKIGHKTLYIKFPGGESSNFPLTESLQSVNFFDDRLDDEDNAQSITAIEKFWDFKSGIFQRVQGALSLKVRVRKVPPDFKGVATNYTDLEGLLMRRLNQAGVESPPRFFLKTINGGKWVSYKLKGRWDSIDYVFPLTESFYIQVQGDFINNSKKPSAEWRNRAEKMFIEIAASIHVR